MKKVAKKYTRNCDFRYLFGNFFSIEKFWALNQEN